MNVRKKLPICSVLSRLKLSAQPSMNLRNVTWLLLKWQSNVQNALLSIIVMSLFCLIVLHVLHVLTILSHLIADVFSPVVWTHRLFTNQKDSSVQHVILKMADRLPLSLLRLSKPVAAWTKLSSKSSTAPLIWNSYFTERLQIVVCILQLILCAQEHVRKNFFSLKRNLTVCGYCVSSLLR